MGQISGIVAGLLFTAMLAAIWQLPPQGAQGQRVPIALLGLMCVSHLLLTPSSEALLAAVSTNSAFLLSHLCLVAAVTLAGLYWSHHLSAGPPTRRRALAARAVYSCGAISLVGLFATSPQQVHGFGFGHEFAGNPRMQIYWILQAVMVIHAVSPLARAVVRAYRRESTWRRPLLAALAGTTFEFIAYELWVIVTVVRWPGMPPPWAQIVTTVLQGTMIVLLVAGTVGPVVAGAVHSTRIALIYLDQLAPLHTWLIERYPQIRFRTRTSLRAETRVTEMLIEISDGLRILHRDEPVLAAAHRVDHDTICAGEHSGSSHHAAYELTAARLFRSRNVTAAVRADPEGRQAGPPARAGT